MNLSQQQTATELGQRKRTPDWNFHEGKSNSFVISSEFNSYLFFETFSSDSKELEPHLLENIES